MIALAFVAALLAQAPTPSPAPIAPRAAPAPRGAPPAGSSAPRAEPAGNAGPASPARPGFGSEAQEIFERRCVFCHAEDGSGQTKKGRQLKSPDFRSERWQKHTSDGQIVEAITKGIPKHKMPAFEDKLSPDQIRALVPYLRGLARR